MFLSVFDMFKVGVGPSSSHTMGPMVAGARFLDLMRASSFGFHGLRASLHGSLAFTGVGHATDRATILGLAGFRPDTYDATQAEAALVANRDSGLLNPPGLPTLAFDPRADLVFDFGPNLPGHANGMILRATDEKKPDLLVMARHSHQPDSGPLGFLTKRLDALVEEFDHMTFGSVSAFLARRVKCTILIIPTHAQAPAAQAAK